MSKQLREFYSNYLVNWLSNGILVNKSKMSSLGIKPLYDKIITKSSVKKIICIDRFDTDFDGKFSLKISKAVASNLPECKVIFSIQNFKSDLNIKSSDYKRKMAAAENSYDEYKSLYDSLTKTEKASGKKIYAGVGSSIKVTKEDLKALKDNFESYAYCHSIMQEGSMYNSYVFVELVAPDTAEMFKLEELVCTMLESFKCSYAFLKSSNSKYLESISPIGFMKSGEASNSFTDNLLSYENLAHLMPYHTHGFIGDGHGNLMGIDMGSKSPFILNFFGSGDRQVNIFLAPAGVGKTVNAFMIALDMLHKGIHCSALDIKGDEWSKLEPLTDLIVIDISSSSGVWVNTLRLDDVPVDVQFASTFFESSVQSTVNLCDIIVGYPRGSQERLNAHTIIQTAVTKLYSSNNVIKESPHTYKNSEGLNYTDLIEMIRNLGESPSNAQYKSLIAEVINRLISTVENTNLFKGKEITVMDIIDKPLVVYSLNKNKSAGDDFSDAIRTFMVSDLDKKKISIRKQQKLGTCCFYEEIQRKEEFKDLVQFICGVVTGARSSNVTVFLLCNTPSILLDPALQAITSNISTYIIGPVSNEDDYDVLARIGCADVVDKVRIVSDNKSKYKHCFVCKFDTGLIADDCVYRALIPPSVLEIVSTRDKLV